jgi:hypothetical protein
MCSEIRVYFEGDKLLKPGFDAFFEEIKKRARERRCSFYLIAGRWGETACRDFAIALQEHPAAWNILLRDSEGPVGANSSVLLCQRQKWAPSLAGSVFWMVEAMEAWFHADKAALQTFYKARFNVNALRTNPNVEEISKKDLEDGLKAATKDTTKGSYYDHKTEHGPKLLASIQPELVRKAAPNCQKLFDAVLARLA